MAKYRHLLDEALDLVPSQSAVLAVLMLRGAQTPGELKGRTERLYPFGALEDVQRTLDELIARELVERLPRRPGQKEERFVQLLGGGCPPGARRRDRGHRPPLNPPRRPPTAASRSASRGSRNRSRSCSGRSNAAGDVSA